MRTRDALAGTAALLLALLAAFARAAPPGAPAVREEPVATPALLAPLPPGTTLDRVEKHPEYVRYYLRTDRAFVVEVTRARGGSPVCSGGRVDLWVRLDLTGDAESFVWDPLPAVVTQACARLPEHPPSFPARTPFSPAPTGSPERASTGDPPWNRLPDWAWRPLHAVVVPFFALCLWLLPRDRAALGAGLVALLVRLGLSPNTVLLGGDAAYERLLRARGLWEPDPYYGETWPAFMGLAWRLLGEPDHFVHAVNVGLSALTVVYVVVLARRVGVGEVGAVAAGLLLALHPLAVAVAGMEDVFVLVGLLQVVALASALGPPREAWLAALAVGLLAHLRPEQAVFALVPLGVLAWRRAWAPLVLAVGLCGWRWVEIVGNADAVGSGAGILGWSRWGEEGFLREVLRVGPGHPAVLLDPTRSPVVLAVLAGIGALGVFRGERRLAIPLVALVVPLVVVLPKTAPLADPIRFQLPAFAFAAVLAGAALGAWRSSSRLGAVAVVALAVSAWFARAPLGGGWAWAHEYTFLRAHLADMPADTVVYYRPDQDPFHHFGQWADAVSPGRWRPSGGAPLEEGAWYWRGFADGAAGTWPPMPCAFEPLAVTEVPSATDGWITLAPGPLQVGFYRVGVCE